jgi:hypothetical protein
MLVGLLLICLIVPWFWRPSGMRGESASTQPINRSTSAAEQVDSVEIERLLASMLELATGDTAPMCGFGHPMVVPPFPASCAGWDLLSMSPVIDDPAKSARWDDARLGGNADWPRWSAADPPIFAFPLVVPDRQWPPANFEASATTDGPNPFVMSALEGIGQALAAYSAADAATLLFSRFADAYDNWLRSAPTEIVESAVVESAVVESPDEAISAQVVPDESAFRLVIPENELAQPPETVTEEPPPVEPVVVEPVVEAPVIEPEQPVVNEPPAESAWSIPQVLFEQLNRLAQHPHSADWAHTTITQLRAITDRDGFADREDSAMLASLAELTQHAVHLAETANDNRLRVELLRAHWGLSRRIDCWKAIDKIHIAAGHPDGAAARVAARGSLHHLFAGVPQLPPVRPDLPALTGNLEAYEQSRDPRLARQVVEQQRTLESSRDTLDQSLAEAVEQHYRNANIRVAITAELLNRLVAQRRSEARLVRDRIAGTPVRGQSRTQSESSIRLHPATGYWHLNLETQGVVESDTLAGGSRARLRSFGATDFVAHKSIVVDSTGVRVNPAAVNAANYSRLAGVRTEFDWIPLIGAYARDRAVEQYHAKRRYAKAEVEAKVAAQAAQQVDRDTQEAVYRIEHDVRKRLIKPIADFGIEVTPIELATTDQRIVARLRVAGHHQLGSHTPRPRALSDSLASLQLHETALTNAAVSLGLDGRRFTAVQLQDLLREKLPRLAQTPATNVRRDTSFEFAYREAVQFRIDDGRMELVLSLSAFQHEGRRTHDFIVHATYLPVVNGLDAELMRAGPLGIEGRLSSAERARLHNAFREVLPDDRRLPIVRLDADAQRRLAGLMITQMVLEDGWLGVAIGPATANRVAERSRSLR